MIIGLAPMDGFTDCAMRHITQEVFDKYGNKFDDLYLRTEFMTADGYCAKPEAVIRHLMTSPNQKNLIAQIHGGNIDTLLQTTEAINKKYAKDFVDIELNLGCPAHNIMKSGGGSELLRDKENAYKIIQALSKASKLPFSIKTRTGLNNEDKENQMQFLLAASPFCSMITIHGRTTNKVYAGEADRNFIYKLRELVTILGTHHAPSHGGCKIIGNGGITSYEDAKSKLGNLDGTMIGQAAIGNPRVFTSHVPSTAEKLETILHHLDLMLTYNSDRPEEKTVIEFRKHLFQYIKGIPDSREFKVRMSEIKSRKEVENEIKKFFS